MRTSIGPRAARIHVGSGRTGFSTGAGPVGYYTSVGGSTRRRTSGTQSSRGASTSAATRQLAAASKVQEASALLDALNKIREIHREDFAPLQRAIAPPPPVRPLADIQRELSAAYVKPLGLFARSARRQAKERAKFDAVDQHRALVEQATALQQLTQRHWDDMWSRLNDNEPDAVLACLATAFEDNEAAAAPVGVDVGEAAVVVLVPTVDMIPERYPTTTAAGNLSLRKMTKTLRSSFYATLVAGYALTTVREALAVAQGLSAVRIVALRDDGPDVYGEQRASVLLAARFSRGSLEEIRWADVSSLEVLDQAATDTVVNFRGAAHEMMPLDLSDEPDIRAVVAAVDLEELAK